MTLTDADIEEFIALTEEEDGIKMSYEEAREAATRVALLYERLLMPTPREIAEIRLAKTDAGGKVSDGPAQPNQPISTA
jgi:hypothetical protein